jgi:hypothetical protein
MHYLNTLFTVVLAWVVGVLFAGGPGYFSSVGGTYDEQTNFDFERQLFYEALTQTFIGSLSKSHAKVEPMIAGGMDQSVDGSAAIWRKRISKGDMVRQTLQEGARGLPTYGDLAVARGDFLPYQNQEYRVNQIDSPAIPIQGRNSRRRAKFSLTDIPAEVKKAVIDWAAEQMEYEAIIGYLYGASPSVLKGTADGGLGAVLGIGGSAGVPLCPRYFYTAQGGWSTYSTTQATWNLTVSDAVGAITQGAAGEVTLNMLKIIRRQLDKEHHQSMMLNGKKYKAVVLTDPDVWYRIDHLLGGTYQAARERAKENPVFGVDYQLEYLGMLFLNTPNLELFRAADDNTNNIPDIGPANGANVLASDPRAFTPTNTNAWMIFLGAGSLLEGYDDAVWTTTETGRHGKGLEIGAHLDLGFKRGDWFAQDGRTAITAAISYGCTTACVYEPGVGTDY